MKISRPFRIFLLLTVLPFLFGCSGIASRMNDTIAQADKLEKMCEVIQSEDIDSTDAGNPHLVWDRLKVRLEKIEDDMKDLNAAVNCPHIDTEKLDKATDSLDALLTSLGNTASLPEFPTCSRNGSPLDNTRQCARAILSFNKDVDDRLRATATSVGELSRALRTLRLALGAQADVTRHSVDYCRQRIAVWQGAVGKIGGSLNALLTRDEAEVLAQYFASRFTTKVSERFMNRLERLVEPIDHLLDKLDDKTYAVSAIMMTLAHNDIRDKLEQAYEGFLGRPEVPSTMRFSLAKAACTRLERVPPPGQRYSQMMPLLTEAFVKFGTEYKTPLLNDVPTKVAAILDTENVRDAAPQKLATANAPAGQGKGTISALALARSVANGAPTAQGGAELPAPLAKEAQAVPTGSADGKAIAVSDAVIADCVASSSDTLDRRLKCMRTAMRETKATMSDEDRFNALASAEFEARKVLTQSDGTVDEDLVKHSGQLALGESVLSYQSAYAAALSNQNAAEFHPADHAKNLGRNGTQDVKNQFNSRQIVQFVLSQSNYASSNKYVTITHDSHDTVHLPTPTPMPDEFCPTLQRVNASLVCVMAGNTYTIELTTSFDTRRWSDAATYQALKSLATTARAMNRKLWVEVDGFASGNAVSPEKIWPRLKPVRAELDLSAWPASSAGNKKVSLRSCGESAAFSSQSCPNGYIASVSAPDGNSMLALARASWAAQVLLRWGDGALTISSITSRGATWAERGNLSEDRKVRISLTSTGPR